MADGLGDDPLTRLRNLLTDLFGAFFKSFQTIAIVLGALFFLILAILFAIFH